MNQPAPSFLNRAVRRELEALQRSKRDKRICDRIRVILLLDRGWSYEEISIAVFLDEGTIRRYYTTYIEKGKGALFVMNYSGSACRLNKSQIEDLEKYVDKETPTAALELVKYVRDTFGVKYTVSAVVALLHRLGFVYKKPKLVPGKANGKAQEAFLEGLQKLKLQLGQKDAIIYMDGVHPQHNSKPGYGWIKKGKEKVLKSNSARRRININGALNPVTFDVTINISDSVNAQSTIELFKNLENKYSDAQRIVIICDNARYYRSRLVQEYLKSSKLELLFLPPYAPNLNLIERLWRFMNKKVRNNKYYEKFIDFHSSIINFFNNISSYKEELSSLMNPKFQIVNL